MRELEASLAALRSAVREYGARSRGELGDRVRSANRERGGADPDACGTPTAGARAVRTKLRNRVAALLRSLACILPDRIGTERHARRP